jgi:membrane protease YdiL (CAAX protease family)
MINIGPTEILLGLLSSLLVAMVAGMFLAWGWVIRRLLTGRPIFPEYPMVSRAETPWGAWTVLLVIFVYLVVNLAMAQGYALATGRVPGKRLPAPPEAAVAPNPPQQQGHEVAKVPARPRSREEIFSMTEMMSVSAMANLVLLILLPLLVRLTSGARLRDFGLSWNGWERQVAVGVVAILFTLPMVYAVQIWSAQIWPVQEHPVHTMVRDEFSVGVADLAILTAVVLAPLFEELMFRGILQSWLVRTLGRRARATASPVSLSDAYVIDLAESPSARAYPDPEFASAEAVSKDQFHSQVTPGTTLAEAEPHHSGALAIVFTSLIFGAVHAPQWPAPIALFLLAIAIGTVYHRTGSLIAAIIMHAAFNAFSTLALFVGLLFAPNIEPRKVPVSWSEPVEMAIQFACSMSSVGRVW